jgi:predicted DNA-binding protein
MPSWPIKKGHKQISVELPAEQVEHLDAEASLRGLGRAGYLRQLIFDDMRRQARAQRQAARSAG